MKPPASKTDAFKQMQQEAQKETLDRLAHTRLQLHRLRTELKNLQGEEDYVMPLLEVVKSWGKKGVSTSELHEDFPDAKKLSEARTALVGDGTITQKKKGNAWLLTDAASATKPSEEPTSEEVTEEKD